MKRLLFRAFALVLDSILVFIITALISSITFINPKIKEIEKKALEITIYESQFEELAENIDSYFEDEVISTEEMDEISKEYNRFSYLFLDFKEDQSATKEKKDKLIENISKEYQDRDLELNYSVAKMSLPTSIVSIVVSILYFGVLQYLFKGQTLFKKIFRIKVVPVDDRKLNIGHYLLRSLIMYSLLIGNIVFLAFKNLFLFTLNLDGYQVAMMILGNIEYVYQIIMVVFVIVRDDQRALHDIILHTKVVRYNKDGSIDESVIFTDREIELKDEKTVNKTNKSLPNKSTKKSQ